MSVPGLIGRYQLGPRLGAGGFAVVWLAHDESLDTQIAIKVMAENWAHRMDVRERFLAEARMLRRASSSRVVQVFDIGELPDGRPYFVMEFADRGTLADRTAAGALPLVEALRVTAEVARGVAELHLAGIVHRDLKPSNVLIRSTPDGKERLLIADLGVAKSLAQASGLTMSVGSAGYMAPEQAAPNSGVDVRADVYSLGAIGYHLITGEDPGAVGQVLPPDRSHPGFPEPVRSVLQRALEADPDQRWPDAVTLAVELEAAADRLEAGSTSGRSGWGRSGSGRSGSGRSGPGRAKVIRRTIASFALIAVLAGAGTAGILEWRKPVRVHDSTRQISLDVPRSWGWVSPSGWNPAVLKLSGDRAAGFIVTDRNSGWNNLAADVNGVFAGRTDDPKLPTVVSKINHSGCRFSGAWKYTSPPGSGQRWSGQVRRWDNCRGGHRTLEEISLVRSGSAQRPERVYLQIRQDSARDDARLLLDGLRVGS